MHYLIDTITGAPEEAQTLVTIQEAIEELNSALIDAYRIRDKLKKKPDCGHYHGDPWAEFWEFNGL